MARHRHHGHGSKRGHKHPHAGHGKATHHGKHHGHAVPAKAHAAHHGKAKPAEAGKRSKPFIDKLGRNYANGRAIRQAVPDMSKHDPFITTG